MKYDYDRLSSDELDELYLGVFGHGFAVNWDDYADHRQEIIDCIESGIPQDVSKVPGGWTAEDGVPGVDFVS